MRIFNEQNLRDMARTSPAYQPHVCDEWFKRFSQPNGMYNPSHAESLRTWLIRFANCPAPQKEKQEASR